MSSRSNGSPPVKTMEWIPNSSASEKSVSSSSVESSSFAGLLRE